MYEKGLYIQDSVKEEVTHGSIDRDDKDSLAREEKGVNLETAQGT